MTPSPPARVANAPAVSPVHRRPRLAMLTTGTRHAAAILDALAARGLRPDTILLEVPRGRAAIRRVIDAVRRRGLTAAVSAIARRTGSLVRPTEPWRGPAYFTDRTDQLVRVPSLVGAETVEALAQAKPDLLILGGAPILPPEVLRIPRLGTLNAHPGILPRFRGVDVVAHAVLAGGPVGASVHWVDTGIDTGRVLATVEVAPVPGDDLARLQERVEAAGAAALAETVDRIVRGDELEPLTQAERFPLCRRLPAAERARAEARLRDSR